jgi:hypothetical protein
LENRQAYFVLSTGFLVYKITEVRDRMFELEKPSTGSQNQQEKDVLGTG